MEQMNNKKQKVQIQDKNGSQNQGSSTGEYADLATKKPESAKKMKKYRKHHKQSSCILKKESRLISGKNNVTSNTRSIKWDNKAIDEQNQNRRDHRFDKNMKSQSQTKYLNYADDGDLYIKNLNKLNQLKFTDDCLKNIMSSLDQSNILNYKKQKSSAIDLKENIEDILTKDGEDQVFDKNLDCESKITLKNTLINKFLREMKGNNLYISPENNLNSDEQK